MVKVKTNQLLAKCKHPNSRRTKTLAKKIKKQNNREKKKTEHAVKANIFGERLSWFAEKIENISEDCLEKNQFNTLIELYLHRFDDELEQISLKQEISKHRSNQHASRQKVIQMNIERERTDYETCGIEMFNLCNVEEFQILKKWDGNSMNIQHMKIKRISKEFLEN